MLHKVELFYKNKLVRVSEGLIYFTHINSNTQSYVNNAHLSPLQQIQQDIL